jgi:hypothetical protein
VEEQMTLRKHEILSILILLVVGSASQPAFGNSAQDTAQSGTDVESTPFATTCGIAVPASSQPSINKKDLVSLMASYFTSCHADLSGIDRVYDEETVDDDWARPLEEKIQEAAAQVKGLRLEGACHRSLCRYDVISDASEANTFLLLHFQRIFLPTVKSTLLEVETTNIPHSANASKEYFYSLVLPAHFVSAFLQSVAHMGPSKSLNGQGKNIK